MKSFNTFLDPAGNKNKVTHEDLFMKYTSLIAFHCFKFVLQIKLLNSGISWLIREQDSRGPVLACTGIFNHRQ